MKATPNFGRILGLMVFVVVSIAAPARGQTWVATGSMPPRGGHSAVLLKDGRVLVVGSFVDPGLNEAHLYDPSTGTWTQTGSLSLSRIGGQTATLLNDGRVLVVGGSLCGNDELYDPATETWTATGSINCIRFDHSATLLNDGRVLVAGGLYGGATAELYDPATGTSTATGSMSYARERHTATLLNDGTVLVAGGVTPEGIATPTAELYDPATGTWTVTGSMSVGRLLHTATLLNDGTVLVAGGGGDPSLCADWNCTFPLPSADSATAEVYDPATGTWRVTGAMADARIHHTATLLANAKVLVAGGALGCDGSSYDTPQLNSAEEYDPVIGTWGARTLMGTGRFAHTATQLADGRVLVAGGIALMFLAEGCGFRTTGAAEMYLSSPTVPTLSSVSVNPTSVTGGTASTGTVTFSTAPADGAAVTLSTSDPAVAAVPDSVTVAAGATSANFTVSTSAVTASTTVAISGTYGGVTRSAGLTVTPPDSEPPETLITSAVDGNGASVPSGGATLSNAITVTFTGTDNVAVAGFECRLDGASFTPCTSPVTYSGFALSRHDFEVRAVDTSGNRDGTPALHTWTVDSPPETTITSVDRRGNTITFSFTGTDNGSVAGFECSLDGAAFTPCTSPIRYGGVSRGTHTFQVRAIDNNGFRDPTPAVFTWTRS